MRHFSPHTWIIVFLLFSGIPALVQAQEMDTDRPGQTISPHTVDAGRLLLEAGFKYEGDKLEDTRLHNITPVNLLLRYGLVNRLELRAGLAFFHKNYVTGGISHHEFSYIEKGLYPVYFGTKVQLLENDGIIPSLAVMGSLSFPGLASKKYAPDHIAPDIRITASHHLLRKVTTGYSIGYTWDGKNDLPAFDYSAILWVAHSMKLASFYEIYGFIPPEAVAADVRFDAGVTWLIIPSFQADLSGGIGITAFAPDFYAGFGFSWIIP